MAKRPKPPRRAATRPPARSAAAAEVLVARLASSLGRRDEVPNQELAAEIAAANDAGAVKTMVALLADGTKAVRSDCIKVLYEVGERRPRLVASHVQAFLSALESRDNRIQWGAMTALSAVTRAELARPVVPPGDDRFMEVLQRRLKGVSQAAKRRRLEKVLKSLGDHRA